MSMVNGFIPTAASVEAIAFIAKNCPSGAITYERLDGGEGEAAPMVNLVRVRENGPLAFHGPVSIAGKPAGLRVTLCRCGASKNKPYCDGSHGGAGFAATGEPATQASEPLAVRNGAIEITPRPNGPLQVKGAIEVVSGTGRTVARSTETFLCRCGASANKPFCDGTHKRIGFVSEPPAG
jgi:CDGSH-type Zn-finger protein